MTHASMGAEARRRAHITDDLVRLSVGIEKVDEIIADLDQALNRAKSGPLQSMKMQRKEEPVRKSCATAL